MPIAIDPQFISAITLAVAAISFLFSNSLSRIYASFLSAQSGLTIVTRDLMGSFARDSPEPRIQRKWDMIWTTFGVLIVLISPRVNSVLTLGSTAGQVCDIPVISKFLEARPNELYSENEGGFVDFGAFKLEPVELGNLNIYLDRGSWIRGNVTLHAPKTRIFSAKTSFQTFNLSNDAISNIGGSDSRCFASFRNCFAQPDDCVGTVGTVYVVCDNVPEYLDISLTNSGIVNDDATNSFSGKVTYGPIEILAPDYPNSAGFRPTPNGQYKILASTFSPVHVYLGGVLSSFDSKLITSISWTKRYGLISTPTFRNYVGTIFPPLKINDTVGISYGNSTDTFKSNNLSTLLSAFNEMHSTNAGFTEFSVWRNDGVGCTGDVQKTGVSFSFMYTFHVFCFSTKVSMHKIVAGPGATVEIPPPDQRIKLYTNNSDYGYTMVSLPAVTLNQLASSPEEAVKTSIKSLMVGEIGYKCRPVLFLADGAVAVVVFVMVLMITVIVVEFLLIALRRVSFASISRAYMAQVYADKNHGFGSGLSAFEQERMYVVKGYNEETKLNHIGVLPTKLPPSRPGTSYVRNLKMEEENLIA